MKTISILGDCGFYNDKTPVMMTDGSVTLSIGLPDVSGEFFFVGKNDGVQIIDVNIVSGVPFTVAGLAPGVLTATVKHYLNGELIDIYPLEPLYIKDVDGKVYGVPEVEEIKSLLTAAEKRIEQLEADRATLTKAVRELHKRILNLEKINQGD